MEKQQTTAVLPDFCAMPAVFAVVLLAELFALILTLATIPEDLFAFWNELALISLLVQWCALFSAAVLCLLRTPLLRFAPMVAISVSYLAVLATIAVVGLLTLALDESLPFVLITASAEGFLLQLEAIGAVVAAIALRYFQIQYRWKRQVEVEHEARLQALQARIRPHFLFNSMNTIANLIATRPDSAEEAVLDLADLFRASLGAGRPLITLEEEVALAEGYLRIEQERLGERLRINWRIATLPQHALLPPLTLQPLVENAIYHGIERLPEGGTLTIEGEVRSDRMLIAISNPLPSKENRKSNGNQMAQENVHQRLVAHFGPTADLTTREHQGEYRVTLRLPIQFEELE